MTGPDDPETPPFDLTKSGLPANSPGSPDQSREVAIDRRMLSALVCPLTQAPLTYDADAQELISKAAHLAYPIRGGIPIMLEEEARKIE